MKRYIPASDDWRTDTDDPQINDFRQIMIENAGRQDDPCVGIFWYDPEENELFGVRSVNADDTRYMQRDQFEHRSRTCTPLHEAIWKKEFYKGKDKRFLGDYTKVPRGRIFEVEDQGFVVCVGSWIDKYPEAKELILDEFELPDDTEFKIDIHWELGHGWS